MAQSDLTQTLISELIKEACPMVLAPCPQQVHWQLRLPLGAQPVPQPVLAGTICGEERAAQLPNLLPALRADRFLSPSRR